MLTRPVEFLLIAAKHMPISPFLRGILLALLLCFASEPARSDKCTDASDEHNIRMDPYVAINKQLTEKYGDWRNPKDKRAACDAVTWYLNVYYPAIIEGVKKVAAACNQPSLLASWIAKEPESRKFQQDMCGAAPPKSASPSHSTATCSTITGGKLPPAPRDKCDAAKKTLTSARSERDGWFGNKATAQHLYRQAAQQYSAAGDRRRAAVVTDEHNASDSKPFIEAEKDAEDYRKNLTEGENNRSIARRIELGAYESNSCGDLLKAAEYYLQSARFYLRANEFDAVNALLLRKDRLEAIVDDATRRGACDGKVSVRRDGDVPTSSPLPPDKCKLILDQIEKIAKDEGRRAGALRVELYPQCPTVVKLQAGDCDRARIVWGFLDHIPIPTIEQRLKAANCKNWKIDG